MAKDARWPMIPFIIVRAVQLFFSIVILGMTAYICSNYAFWWASLGVFISLVVMLWMVANFILFFLGLLLPLAVVIVDAFCLVFVLITMAGTGASGYLEGDCTYTSFGIYFDFNYTSTTCKVSKGAFALELLLMFIFVGTLVVASLTLHKTRKDLRGKKYNAGLPFVSGSDAEQQAQPGMQEAAVQPQYQQPTQPEQAYTQQTMMNQQPAYPQQPYQQGPAYEGFVSPPTSPPPMQHSHSGGVSSVGTGVQPQHSGQYSTTSSGAPLQPAYPTHEMQGTVPQPKNELPS